jgi:hypothetical protein
LLLSSEGHQGKGREEARQEGEAAVTPDAIIGLVRTLVGALHGQYGEAVQKAAIEAMARIAAGLCSRACETLSMAGLTDNFLFDPSLG